VFEELGGWDEAFVNGAEDVDLCIKARIAGHRVVYRGDAHVLHDEGMATKGAYGRDGNLELLHSRYGGMMDDDSDRIASLFDARFNHLADGGVAAPEPPADLAVDGQVSGLAPEAFEARAWIAGLEAAGAMTSARDWASAWIVPRLTDAEWRPVLSARVRPRSATARILHVSTGSHCAVPPGVAIVRAGERPAALPEGAVVWAASPSLVDAFVDAGVPRSQVRYLPPPIAPAAPGGGGEGVLALLPAHDLPACDAQLSALATVATGMRLRLLPSVASSPLLDLVAERAPGAELLTPVTSELRLQALARDCDVVVDLDRSEVFGRRALSAAAAGAAVVTVEGGAAAAVLGDLAAPGDGHDADSARYAIEAALARAAERTQRSARVAETCAPAVVTELAAAGGERAAA
jgi:hypothetical protein